MSKKIKVTSSLLAGTLLLVNGVPFANPVQAKDAPMVSVEKQNNNITAQVVEQNGKNYLSVTALKDVSNVSVKVKVSNGQVITFKQASLKVNETVMFELNIKDPEAIKAAKAAKAAKKSLPKTEVVRESLLLKGKVKGYDVNAVISYDVEKAEPTAKVDVLKSETSETKKESKVDADLKVELSKGNDELTLEEIEKTVDSKENKAEKTEAEVNAENDLKALENKKGLEKPEAPVAPKVETAVKPAPEKAPRVEEGVKAVLVEGGSSDIDAVLNKPAAAAKPAVTASADAGNFRSAPKAAEVAPKETPAKTNKVASLQGVYDEAVAREVYNQLNAHRAKHGLKPLAVAVELSAGTEVRAKEFAQKALSGFSGMALHTRLDNSQWYTAFGGYGAAKGENVSYSVNGASGMMGFWKNSPSHNATMLNPKYTKVLVKVFKHGGTYYGVQIFG